MLALDAPRWQELHHAYGSAADVPDLLRALAVEAGDHETAWHHIWSALCHQGDTYPASYAAVPHLIAIAARRDLLARIEYLTFAASVAAAGGPVPADLDADYRGALAAALPMVDRALAAGPDAHEVAWLLWAAVALRGLDGAARALEPFADGGTVMTRCPAETCGVSLCLDHEGDGWAPLAVEDDAGSPPTAIEPPRSLSPSVGWSDVAAPAELARVAEQYGHPAMARKLELLMGTARCPKCQHWFPLWPEVLDPGEL